MEKMGADWIGGHWSHSPHHQQQLQHWQRHHCHYVAFDLLNSSFPDRKFNDQTFAAPNDMSTSVTHTHIVYSDIVYLEVLK